MKQTQKGPTQTLPKGGLTANSCFFMQIPNSEDKQNTTQIHR
jgi:hypothetical protein